MVEFSCHQIRIDFLAGLFSTLIPLLTQEPIISFTLDFRLVAYEISIFILAIFTIASMEIFPTKSFPAVPDPLDMLASFAIRAVVGGTPTSTLNFLCLDQHPLLQAPSFHETLWFFH